MGHHEHPNESPRLLTVAEVAERLNISIRAVFVLIANDELPRVKIGHRTVRVLESDVQAFIDDLRGPGQRGRLVPLIIHRELDELQIEQAFALTPQRMIRHCVYPALEALNAHGVYARRSHLPPNGGVPKVTLPDGTTLNFVQSRKDWAMVYAFIAHEALHADAAAAYERALRALAIVAQVSHYRWGGPLPPPALRSVAFCVDLQGLRVGATTPSRIVTRLKQNVIMDPTGTVITSINCPSFFRAYNKDAEIEAHPSKAYIREFHRRGGWQAGSGAVWRIEFTLDRRLLKQLARGNGGSMPALDELWQYALDRVSLRRKPRSSASTQVSRWPEAPLWRMLRTLRGWEPWAERPQPPTAVAESNAQSLDRTMATLMGHAVRAALLAGRQGQPIERVLSELVDA